MKLPRRQFLHLAAGTAALLAVASQGDQVRRHQGGVIRAILAEYSVTPVPRNRIKVAGGTRKRYDGRRV